MQIPNLGKCPGCGNVLSSVVGGHVTINIAANPQRHGLAYSCPNCQVILSVEMDPIAIRTEIVAQVKEARRS